MFMDRIAACADAVWRGRDDINSRMDELASYIYPDRRGFIRENLPGEEGRGEIWDGTPEDAAQTLGAALGGLLTNPATDWFSLEPLGGGEMDAESSKWLSDAARRMLAAYIDPATGFQNEVNAFYLDLPVFGWGVFWTEYRDGEGLRFKALPPSQCAMAEDASGRVDTIVRRYPMTAAQMLEEFGENVGEAVKNAVENDPQREFSVTHIVAPRSRFPAGGGAEAEEAEEEGFFPRRAARAKKNVFQSVKEALPDGAREYLDDSPGFGAASARQAFVSVYFETQTKHPLHVGGYFEPPFQAPRWSKRSGEIYGRGPGHAALPDIRVLNAVAGAQLTAAEKQADPPLLVPDDGVLGKINTHSGGITYYTPGHGDRIAPLPVASNLEVMEAIILKRQEAVRRAFLNDRLQTAPGPQMTATEVMARERKRMLVLGPVLGRLQAEFLGPLVARTFALLYRAGELPEAPAGLRGRETLARYVSPVARAQKQDEADSFAGALAFIAPLARANPRLLDNFDADAVVRGTQEVFGYPQKYLRPVEEVAAERAALAGRAVPPEGGGNA